MSAADMRAWAQIAEAARSALGPDLSPDTRVSLLEIAISSLSRSLGLALDAEGLPYAEGRPDDAEDAPADKTAPTAAERRAEREAQWRAEREAQLAEKRAWRALPRWQRERMLLETLGDKRMSAGELARQLRGVAGGSGFSEEYTRMLLRELVEAGELVEAKATSGRCRFVYSRRTELSGPIADLERAFHEPPEGQGEVTT